MVGIVAIDLESIVCCSREASSARKSLRDSGYVLRVSAYVCDGEKNVVY